MTISIGDLMFPLALITLFWGLGLFNHKGPAWFLQWKYWKQILICLLSWVFFAMAIFYEFLND